MSVTILVGDCRETLRSLADNSVHAVVCDPPYHLTSIVKRFGGAKSHLDVAAHKDQSTIKAPQYGRLSKGFMGQTWDGGDVAFQPETWGEVLRVLKPGGHCVAFSGTRTYHRLATAIELAGFEVRDLITDLIASDTHVRLFLQSLSEEQQRAFIRCIDESTFGGLLSWCFGSGFPKSHDISKAIDKARDDSAEGSAVGAWLKEQREARGFKQKEVAALWPSVTGGLTGCVANWETLGKVPKWDQWLMLKEFIGFGDEMDAEVWRLNGRKGQPGEAWNEREVIGTSDNGIAGGTGKHAGMNDAYGFKGEFAITTAATDAAREWEGWGTALKPATEPICLARKPLSEKSIAANVLKWGTGAINVDGCRISTEGEEFSTPQSDPAKRKGVVGEAWQATGDADKNQAAQRASIERTATLGRFPANLCHDGSDEVVAGFPAEANVGNPNRIGGGEGGIWNDGTGKPCGPSYADSGSAARFFYTAKASSDERGEYNTHPTVKPIALMRWLVRLVTPKGGTVLDPFAGSGSTLIAADAEQFDAIGCELSPEYAAIAERRIRDAAGMFANVTVDRSTPPATEAA